MKEAHYILPRKLLSEKMSWELAVWRTREMMEMVIGMMVVMIVRGGLLLCLQHSIPGTYNLNIIIIINIIKKRRFYLKKLHFPLGWSYHYVIATYYPTKNKCFNQIKEIFLVLSKYLKNVGSITIKCNEFKLIWNVMNLSFTSL